MKTVFHQTFTSAWIKYKDIVLHNYNLSNILTQFDVYSISSSTTVQFSNVPSCPQTTFIALPPTKDSIKAHILLFDSHVSSLREPRIAAPVTSAFNPVCPS